ncbi:hypothetical protein NT6N_16280 [Oceaniferula spumae]|uniref:Uncharacterized protein n=1 Tax=Oceaniferula spumae TaxID=2979115 RepID=A0AAT9FKW9_9BACT
MICLRLDYLRMHDDPSHQSRFVVMRGQEESWAAKHCRLTRILGISMIAGFVFQIASAIFTDHLQVDIFLIIGGISILKGSQAWLRFYIFFTILMCVSQFIGIVVPLIKGEPLEISHKWVDYHDLAFWLEAALPLGFYIGFATLCLVTLKSRQLVFWTRTCKRWIRRVIYVVGAIYLIIFILWLSNRKSYQARVEQAKPSLQAVEDYVNTYAASSGYPHTETLKQRLADDPSILQVSIYYSPNSSMTLINRNEHDGYDEDWHYEHFVKTTSGNWILIRAKLKE